MNINFLDSKHILKTVDDRILFVDFDCEKDTVYISDGDEPRFYSLICPYSPSSLVVNNRVLWLSVSICGISESEASIFSERVKVADVDPVKFVYSERSFCEKHNVPNEIIRRITDKMIVSADFLTAEESERFRTLLNKEGELTDNDKSFISKTSILIKSKITGREIEFYMSVAHSIIKDGYCLKNDIFAACKERHLRYYKLRHCAARIVGRKNIVITRRNSKRLREYLDD